MDAIRNSLENLTANETGLALVAAGLLFVGLVFARIFGKAGHHPALGFLMLVPILNVVMLLSLAFGRWPIEREVRGLRRALKDATGLRRAA